MHIAKVQKYETIKSNFNIIREAKSIILNFLNYEANIVTICSIWVTCYITPWYICSVLSCMNQIFNS